MKDNKGLIIGTVVIIIVLLSLILLIGKSNKVEKLELSNNPEIVLANAEKEAAAVKESDKKNFEEISVNDYLDYYKGDTPSLVFFTKSSCHNCDLAQTIIQSLMKKYRIKIGIIRVDVLDEEAYNAIIDSDPSMENNFGTPMLFLVGNDSIIDSVDGLTDRAHYIEFFKMNGYI